MSKDTSEMLRELQLCEDFQTFYNQNRTHMQRDGLPKLLDRLLRQSGLKKSHVIKQAELSEIYGYQIFAGKRLPSRDKLLCLAVAMQLDLGQVQMLLQHAGYAPLHVKDAFDSVVLYGICKHMTVLQINGLLFSYDLRTMG